MEEGSSGTLWIRVSLYKTVYCAAIKLLTHKMRIVLARVMHCGTFSLSLWHNLFSGRRVETELHTENWTSFVYYYVEFGHAKELLQLCRAIVGHIHADSMHQPFTGKCYCHFSSFGFVTNQSGSQILSQNISVYSCFFLLQRLIDILTNV